jgi:hypothetical protein
LSKRIISREYIKIFLFDKEINNLYDDMIHFEKILITGTYTKISKNNVEEN